MSPETRKSVDRIEKNFDREIIGEDARDALLYELYLGRLLSDDEHFELCAPVEKDQEVNE